MSARITITDPPATTIPEVDPLVGTGLHRDQRVQIRPGTHVGAQLVGGLIGNLWGAVAGYDGRTAVRVDDERHGHPDQSLPVWVLASDVTPLPHRSMR